jgi:hypothetical protein
MVCARTALGCTASDCHDYSRQWTDHEYSLKIKDWKTDVPPGGRTSFPVR